jgi:hypothetical protein
MMAPKRNSQRYPQSHGNLALDDETIEFLPANPFPRPPVLRVVSGILDEDPTIDALSPATGLFVGAGLSVILWCLIALVIVGVVNL